MDKMSRRDLLSDLPSSIIHMILALVPIRDAIKTSVLSRQWRYTWASLPHLVFKDECQTDKTSLNHFITQALFLHKRPILNFELFFIKPHCITSIDQWLISLSRTDLTTLVLYFCEPSQRFQIHSSVYSCKNLAHLKLWNCKIPPSPSTFNGFSRLRFLALTFVELDCKVVESIIANSPLLEEVALSSNTYSGRYLEWRIHAPNLKYFYVDEAYIEIFLHAPLLSKLVLYTRQYKFTAEHLRQRSSVCNYVDFLGGFTNLEELRVEGNVIKFLSIGIESCHSSLVFHHLRAIDIRSMSFHDIKYVWIVVRLIMGAPNLHKLQIRCDHLVIERPPDVASISFWDSENASTFVFEQLKVIELWNAHGVLNEMKLVAFLLASSPVLERLGFQASSRFVDDHMIMNLRAELLSYHRASLNAKILVR